MNWWGFSFGNSFFFFFFVTPSVSHCYFWFLSKQLCDLFYLIDQNTANPSPASLLLFVQSIARTNLEIELLQRGDSIIGVPSTSSSSSSHQASASTSTSSPTPGTSSASWNSPGLELHFSSSPTPSGSASAAPPGGAPLSPWSLLPKRSCLLPLLHVLATHSKILTTQSYSQLWSHISGLAAPSDSSATSSASLCRYEKEVPLLVQDVSCLLIQMVLILPLPLHRQHLTCLVQRLFNVLTVQITTQLTCRLGERKRKLYKTLTFSEWNLAALMSCVVACLDDSHLYIVIYTYLLDLIIFDSQYFELEHF